MKKKFCKILLFLAPILFFGGCQLLNNDKPADQKMELSASPSKILYALNEPIIINISLKNPSKKAIVVSNWNESSIEIKSLKKDGIDVKTHSTLVKYDDDLKLLLKEHLISLSPDSSLSFSMDCWNNKVLGGVSLGKTDYSSTGAHQITSFFAGEAGKYELEVFYKYTGPSDLVSDILLTESNPVKLSFEVK